jgi:hypothetical protein
MPKDNRAFDYMALAVLGMSMIGIHYLTDRHQTVQLILLYTAGFAGYIYLTKSTVSVSAVLISGALVRLALFFAAPSLSEDVYRFIWDGRMMHAGLHPFAATPEALMRSGVEFDGLDLELFHRLNSSIYYTIYPPISQFVFWLSTFSSDVFVNIAVMRGIIFVFDLGTIYLLHTYFNPTKSAGRLAIYALNPLVILELTGNLHFEGILVFFLLLGIVAIKENKPVWTGLAMALGIGVKLIPLMFLPTLIKRWGWKRATAGFLVIGFVLISISIPLWNQQLFVGLKDSLSLFFNRFEFNAGLYFLIRELGFAIHGYDVIQTVGPLFSMIAMGLILWMSFRSRFQNLDLTKLFSIILLIQLLLATTVHPWYVIPLVAMGVGSGFLFPIVWSYFIFFTYIGYNQQGYEHPMFWILVEYLAVGVTIIYDFKSIKKEC